jgi:hypothetical protein
LNRKCRAFPGIKHLWTRPNASVWVCVLVGWLAGWLQQRATRADIDTTQQKRDTLGVRAMESTKRRMILVAVLVCGFAVGMAALLNYFKYRSTAERLVHERLVVTGQAIENTIQSSLALGLQFSDIGTLPGTLERERATDDLIQGIDVFDTTGQMLYSTDRVRATRPAPPLWMAAIKKVGEADWFVSDKEEAAAGISIQNNFGLTIGHLALRYSDQKLDSAVHAVGSQLALAALGVFAMASLLASLALLTVMGKLSKDVTAVEAALRAADPARAAISSPAVSRGPFRLALQSFFDQVRKAEKQLAELRGQLNGQSARGTPPAGIKTP